MSKANRWAVASIVGSLTVLPLVFTVNLPKGLVIGVAFFCGSCLVAAHINLTRAWLEGKP